MASGTKDAAQVIAELTATNAELRDKIKELEKSLWRRDLHNEGGEIKVTQRMKGYFWHRYYACVGGFGRKKNGEKRNDHRTQQLSSEAAFWKFMALMKMGSIIKIPRRQFLGASPEVEKAVTEIIEQNLEEYFNNEFKLNGK